MFIATVREKTDTIKICIHTSADGLAGIPVDEYASTLLEMVVEAYPHAFVEVTVDERSNCASRVSVIAINGVNLPTREEMDVEARVLEMTKNEAFEACCSRSLEAEERIAEQRESIARGMRGAS